MKTKFHPRLFAFLLVGLFLLAVPLPHHSSAAWAGTKVERSSGETEGDPENYNDHRVTPVRPDSSSLEVKEGVGERFPRFDRVIEILKQLFLALSVWRWTP